jgi:tRNA dimethylallyltransferase
MDIGTAKPTPEELARVPHHLIDIADPDETVGLAQFIDLAKSAIDEIHGRSRIPFLVGGTGQYIRAIVRGWDPPAVPPQPELRAELEAVAAAEGTQALHDRLAELDPPAAERIDHRNVRRVVRALEVCIVSGERFSDQRTRTPPSYRILQVGLTMDREALYERVDARLEAMIEAGLPEEVRGLLAEGYDWELPAMSGLGYSQFRPYFEGRATKEEVVAEIQRDTRSFIRHQYNWFRPNSPHIVWFDVSQTEPHEVLAFVQTWLEGERQSLD